MYSAKSGNHSVFYDVNLRFMHKSCSIILFQTDKFFKLIFFRIFLHFKKMLFGKYDRNSYIVLT